MSKRLAILLDEFNENPCLDTAPKLVKYDASLVTVFYIETDQYKKKKELAFKLAFKKVEKHCKKGL